MAGNAAAEAGADLTAQAQAPGSLAIPQFSEIQLILGSEAETPEALHSALVAKIVNWDCADTITGTIGILKEGEVDTSIIPPSILQVSEGTDLLDTIKSHAEDEEVPFPFTAEQATILTRWSLDNSRHFEEQAQQAVDPEAQKTLRIRAAEARFIPTILLNDLVIKKLFGKGWKSEPLGDVPLPAVRRNYIAGTIPTLEGYEAFKTGVAASDLSEAAQLTVDGYNQLRNLGISSFRDLYNLLGMTPGATEEQAVGAVALFEGMAGDLNTKIEALIGEGRIPETHRHTFAAYALAAVELDKAADNSVEVTDAEKLLKHIAGEEAIEIPDGTILVRENAETETNLPVTSIIGYVSPTGEAAVGSAVKLPTGTTRRMIAHEFGHALHNLLAQQDYKSPLLGTKLPRMLAEQPSTYTEYKYGSATDTYYGRLFSVRFSLLNEAQMRHVGELDKASTQGDIEAVAQILRGATEPTERMQQTFGAAVAGEGFGLPYGAFGLYGNANTAVLKQLEADSNTTLRNVVEHAIFSN